MEVAMKDCNLFSDGNFFIGVNYWASNAGINMWNTWDENAVIRDLDLLAEANVHVIRMFPLWSDFQPIVIRYGGNHSVRDIAFDDYPMPHTKEAAAGVDPVMIERFECVLDLCAEREISVMIGLLTGWMSGKLYVPRALDGVNLLSDPLALKWEMKYIKYLVNRFKDHSAVVAWDIGNECNCLEINDNVDLAYAWSCTITNAIRAEDNTHPVISGMHGLDPNGTWRPQDQGEITDVLCTHPYPAFTAYCDTDPINRMKSANHAVAESLFYRGIGQKPCFAEEINLLGPMFANEELTAANADMVLFGLWAHNCFGYMWWCACNQSALSTAPYDWNALERELALIYADGTHIKALDSMTAFSQFTERIGKLPPRITDGVCITLRNQDTWATAYGTFLLAKQAGIELEFAYTDMEIPKADVYFLSSLTLYAEPTKHLWHDLLDRVYSDGATLYISMDGGMLSEFSKATGFELVTRSVRTVPYITEINGKRTELFPKYDMRLRAVTAEPLATLADGSPVFGKKAHGKGTVYFINAPIEYTVATQAAVTDGDRHQPYYEFYKAMNVKNSARVAEKSSPFVGLTEHIINENERYLLLINYLPEDRTETVTLNGYKAVSVESVSQNATLENNDGGFTVFLPKNSGAVVKIEKL